MITIVEQPDRFTPAFNPVFFSLTSDNYAQPGFKFVADIYTGTGELIATQKFQPQPVGTDPVTFDISVFLRELVAADYCKLNTAVSPSIVTTAGGALAGYSVQFGEEYDGTLYANMINFSGYVYNASINYLRFAFYYSADYLNKRFMTQLSRQVQRKRDSSIISMLQSDTVAVPALTLNIYNMLGASIYTNTIINPYTSLSTASNRMLHIHCGFDYLYFLLAFPSSIYGQASYYTISTAGGDVMRFDLYSRCERFPGVRLYFLNELGGFDAFNFMLVDRKSIKPEKKIYKRQPANKRTGYDPAARRFEALERSYFATYEETIKATSDYLTDKEAALLAELITSPLIYLEIDTTEYGGPGLVLVPVALEMNEYTLKKVRADGMFNLEIDANMTYTNLRQSL